ncbi:hypothetical protein FRX31_017512 [Thalictrum thalictroides]|uniref:Uncharacterized protein n=1 Tax=Thalictrum thalictroides TaxID=46969 RepID=A0A7J6W6Q0_THATH|nr:hypothetical protein FRX31_017512 [Thalictrum thalictroides]
MVILAGGDIANGNPDSGGDESLDGHGMINQNPDAKRWQNKTFPWHEHMVILAGGDITTGDHDNGRDESLDGHDVELGLEGEFENGPTLGASSDGVSRAPGFTQVPRVSTNENASTDVPLRHDIPLVANANVNVNLPN